MADQIEEHRVRKYAAGIDHLAQQKFTRIRSKVRVETDVNAKISFWDQIDSIGMIKKTARHSDTPIQDMPHKRRSLITNTYETGALVDPADLTTVLNDPTGAYGQSMAMAAGRQTDDIIIAAADATAQVGEDGTDTALFPAGQIETTATAMTLEKMLAAKRILDGNEVDPSQMRHALMTAIQFEDALNETEIQSADFNTVKALVQGEISTFLGFAFERSERLLIHTGTIRKCLFYSQGSILLGVASDVVGKVGERADKSYNIQVYYKMTMGCTRMDETGVVVVQADEA